MTGALVGGRELWQDPADLGYLSLRATFRNVRGLRCVRLRVTDAASPMKVRLNDLNIRNEYYA
jgi:hypothetical protein